IDLSYRTIIVEIVGEAVMKSPWIEPHVRIVSKEERAARSYAYVELNPIVSVAVHIVIPFAGVRPSFAVLRANVLLIGPTGVIKPGGNRMGRRNNRQQIDDHGCV